MSVAWRPGAPSRALYGVALGATWRIRGDRERLQVNHLWKRESSPRVRNNLWVMQYQRYLW